jgi:hypothetical protein
MDLLQVNGMSQDERLATRAYLLQQIESLAQWQVLSNSPQGKFILDDRKDAREKIRSIYAATDLTKPNALIKMARLQGAEGCLDAEIHALESVGFAKEILDKELEAFNVVIDQKPEVNSRGGSPILSSQVKEHEDG